MTKCTKRHRTCYHIWFIVYVLIGNWKLTSCCFLDWYFNLSNFFPKLLKWHYNVFVHSILSSMSQAPSTSIVETQFCDRSSSSRLIFWLDTLAMFFWITVALILSPSVYHSHFLLLVSKVHLTTLVYASKSISKWMGNGPVQHQLWSVHVCGQSYSPVLACCAESDPITNEIKVV